MMGGGWEPSALLARRCQANQPSIGNWLATLTQELSNHANGHRGFDSGVRRVQAALRRGRGHSDAEKEAYVVLAMDMTNLLATGHAGPVGLIRERAPLRRRVLVRFSRSWCERWLDDLAELSAY